MVGTSVNAIIISISIHTKREANSKFLPEHTFTIQCGKIRAVMKIYFCSSQSY